MNVGVKSSQRRDPIAGLLIVSMVLLTISEDILLHESYPNTDWLNGVFGWFAAALLFSGIKASQKLQIAVIIGIGLVLHIVSAIHGIGVDFGNVISINAGLISMIAAVGFLRLVVNPGQDNEILPVGSIAYYRTMVGVWLFGSVINISAPIIFADRLFSRNCLGPLASQSIVRVFSTCSAWSPFFGGTAVVLTYVPDINLGLVILLCLPFSLFGLGLVLVEGRVRYSSEILVFKGYPVQFTSLWVPAVLAVVVMFLSWWKPEWSILTHISVGALFVSIVGLKLNMNWVEVGRSIRMHVTNHLPNMVNELCLFLAAGVLASGLASYLASDTEWISIQSFGLMQALFLLGVMVLLALVGVHPVVTVSGVTPLLLSLNPNPDMLAVVYLLGWSLGTCVSPLSGTHLVFQGRYGISSWRAAARNWSFVCVLYIVAIPFLVWISNILGT